MPSVRVDFKGDASNLKAAAVASERMVDNFAKKASGLGKKLAAAFSVAAVGAIGRSMVQAQTAAAEYGGRLDDLKRETGLATSAIQGLDLAARDAGLGGADAFLPMIGRIREMQDALKAGGQEGLEATNQLIKIFGAQEFFTMKPFSDMAPGEAFNAVAVALKNAGDDGERLGAIFDLLGSKAQKMRGFIEGIGDGGIEALAAKFKGMGAVMSDETAAAMDRLDFAMMTRAQQRQVRAAEGFATMEAEAAKAGPAQAAIMRERYMTTMELLSDPIGTMASAITGKMIPKIESIANALSAIVERIKNFKPWAGRF